MNTELTALDLLGLRDYYYTRTKEELDVRLQTLRPQQLHIVQWARESPKPYLLVNAPTGIGKTLIGGVYAASSTGPFSYVVSTKALQDQVNRDLGIPTLKGRDNFECLIGQETHGFEITAARAVCAFNEWCKFSGSTSPTGDAPSETTCGYYGQRIAALLHRGRVTNYPMALSMPTLRDFTSTLILDEAHRIEQTVINSASIILNRGSMLIYGVKPPRAGDDITKWAKWARSVRVKAKDKYDFQAKKLQEVLVKMGKMDSNVDNWIVDNKGTITKFSPIFGTPFVLPNLFGHEQLDTQELLKGDTGRKGVRKVMMMSATLLAPDLMERTLGLPANSYDYLDLDSPFPTANRPINYAPVMRMNKANTATAAGRAPMTNAMDKLIDHYLLTGRKCGIIHAVSRWYRDSVVVESRWRSIMTTDPLQHARSALNGKASVLVSDNIIDGWDGADDLCRFVLMPKVPFANIGDRHVAARQQKDPRSYDYSALVSVVQGVGRGVRHENDKAENWILDESWEALYRKRGNWLPEAFLSAYHHGVPL